MEKRILTYCLILALLISSVANASALTGRLGNSRMILHPEVGEEVERYLLIQNVNDVPIIINMTVSGELAENVELIDNGFTLQPGDEKKAYFTIEADEPGTTETKINVAFSPTDGGAGVGLAAVIIVVASGEGTGDDGPGANVGGGDDPNNTGNDEPQGSNGEGISTLNILLIITGVLILAFIVLMLFYAKKSKSKKRSGRPCA